MKLKTFLLAGIATAVSSAAIAQCSAPTAEEQFYFIQEAQVPYLMVYGTITPDENAVGEHAVDQDGNAVGQTFAANFHGKKFDGVDFGTTVDIDMMVSENCLGGSCGVLDATREGVFILRDLGGAYHFSLDNCGFFGEYEPTSAQLDTYKYCGRYGCEVVAAAN